MPTLIHQRVRAAQSNENPTVICRMPSGWAVIGDHQFIPGYTLLLPDPVVADLNSLTGTRRTRFLDDMALIGDALLEVTPAYRINYEILGNSDQALHAHIFPRFWSEPEAARAVPVWMGYTSQERCSRPFDIRRDQDLIDTIAGSIHRRL